MSIEQLPPDARQWAVLDMKVSPPTIYGPFPTEDEALDYAGDDLEEDYEVLPMVAVERPGGWKPLVITGGRQDPSEK